MRSHSTPRDGIIYDGDDWRSIDKEQAQFLVDARLIVKCEEQEDCRTRFRGMEPVPVMYHISGEGSWAEINAALAPKKCDKCTPPAVDCSHVRGDAAWLLSRTIPGRSTSTLLVFKSVQGAYAAAQRFMSYYPYEWTRVNLDGDKVGETIKFGATWRDPLLDEHVIRLEKVALHDNTAAWRLL